MESSSAGEQLDKCQKNKRTEKETGLRPFSKVSFSGEEKLKKPTPKLLTKKGQHISGQDRHTLIK